MAVGLALALEAQQSALPPGGPTDRTSAEEVAKLKFGPPFPFQASANWPQMLKGHH
jgi:hypothetical protein